ELRALVGEQPPEQLAVAGIAAGEPVGAELVDPTGLRLRLPLGQRRSIVGVGGGLDPGQQPLELALGKAAQGKLDAALSELGQQLGECPLLPLAVGVVVAQGPEAGPLALE